MVSEPITRPIPTAPVGAAPPGISLPLGTDTSVFFTDESGAKGTGGQFFVVAGVKVRDPGALIRAVRHVRDTHRHRLEFKFSEISKANVPVYLDLIKTLYQSDARLVGFVIDKTLRDPFDGIPHWQAHAKVTAQLIHGNINRAEVAVLLMDEHSCPKEVAIADVVRRQVNERMESTNLIASVALDSRATDGLQLADLVAGAISFDRRVGGKGRPSSSPKAVVARSLAAQFGLENLGDVRNRRVNILTSRHTARPTRRQELRTGLATRVASSHT